MTCTQVIDTMVVECKSVFDGLSDTCTEWADEGHDECIENADQGYNECNTWADHGHNNCTSQYHNECHWYSPWNCVAGWLCSAYYWVANWICVGWTWFSKWVCIVSHWVAKWVCKAFAWIMKVVCSVTGFFFRLVCTVWLWLKCSAIGAGQWVKDHFWREDPKPLVTHVFHLMLENRSFDHLFGMSGLTGTDVKTGHARMVNGVTAGTFTNIDKKPDPAPPNPPYSEVTLTLAGGAPFQLLLDEDDPPHDFDDIWVQLAGHDGHGRYLSFDKVWQHGQTYPEPNMQGFVASYNRNIEKYLEKVSPATETFACFNHDLTDLSKSTLPVLATLAQEFVICDKWHSSLPGPTWPNRFFAHAASSGGLDHSPSAVSPPWGKKSIFGSTVIDGFRFENGTIFDRLDENCHKWRIFEGDEFPISIALAGMNINMIARRFGEMSNFKKEVHDTGYSPRYTFIEPRYGEADYSALGGFADNYRCGNSMHPLNSVVKAEALIKEVYETIRSSPHWNSSVLIITFDEHGGFADHVPPPPAIPPGDTPTESYVHHGFRFDRFGVRVPTLIVSPLVPRNGIDGTLYDHTSVLATLEKLLDMEPLTERDKGAADFLHLFNPKGPRSNTPETLPSPATEPHSIDCSGFALAERQSGLETTRAALAAGEDPAIKRLEERPITGMQIGFAFIALQRMAVKQTQRERDRWRQRFTELKTRRDFLLFMTDAKLRLRHGIDHTRPVRPPRLPRPPRRDRKPPPDARLGKL